MMSIQLYQVEVQNRQLILIFSIMSNNMEVQGFRQGEIALLLNEHFKQGQFPVRVIRQAGFGVFQIRIYGDKADSFASYYNLTKLTIEKLQAMKSNVQKNNKKKSKLLKKVEKDYHFFLNNSNHNAEFLGLNKLYFKEEQLEDDLADALRETKVYESRWAAIKKTRVKTLIEEYENKNISVVLRYKDIWGAQIESEESIKQIFILKLKFVLDELVLDIDSQLNQIICQQIIGSNLIEPMEYFLFPLFFKIHEYLQKHTKKNNRGKFRGFLVEQQQLLIKSLGNYLENYSVFKMAAQKFSELNKC